MDGDRDRDRDGDGDGDRDGHGDGHGDGGGDGDRDDTLTALGDAGSTETGGLAGDAGSASLEFLRALAHVSERTPASQLAPLAASAPELSSLGACGDPARFTLVRRLGEGGFGTVHEALDRARGATVALKILRRRGGQALLSFKQEFRALSGIAHPNLVQLYELFADEERWFFTMELVRGEDLRSFALASGRGRGAAGERVRAAFAELAEGLSFLHEAGKLHRDIKPSNVLVDGEGRVKILDFGLVLDLEDRAPPGQVAGTPRYMAPEQAAALPIGPAADWYAVGVLLHEALTGQLPERGAGAPRSPLELSPDVPEELAALCVELLQQDPARRPSGAEVRARLASRAPAEGLVFAARRPGAGAPFVGREAELRRLREALDAARPGRPAVALLRGASGVGKSALAQRLLEARAREEPEALALAGRCFEQEAVPYKALDSLIDALCKRLLAMRPAEVDEALPADAGVLARVFPVLRQLEPIDVAARRVDERPADPIERRRRAFGALRALLGTLSGGRPAALLIDDLQWGDLDSVALLLDLLRPPDAPPLLLIATFRAEDAEASPVLGAFLSGLRELGDAVAILDVPVGDLAPAEAEELARTLSGDEAAARAIAAEGRGNALFIAELCRWAEEEALAPAAERPAAPPDLSALIRARVERLPEPAQRLLTAVMVAGRPLGRTSAAAAAALVERERAGAEEAQALALLRAGQLLRVRQAHGREELLPYHERVREAALAGLSAEERRACHARLGRALEASGEAEPEQLLGHFREAGLEAEAARYAARAAAQAFEALAFDRAARLYREALALGAPDGEEALYARLAEALMGAGRPREAAEAHLAAAARAARRAPGAALAHRRLAAEQLLTGGYVDEGLREIRELLREIGVAPPASRPGSLARAALTRLRVRARGLGSRERPEASIPEAALLEVDACWAAAAGISLADPVRASALQARHLLLALELGEPFRLARALAVEAVQGMLRGRRTAGEDPERLAARSAALAERAGRPEAAGLAAVVGGVLAEMHGDLRAAESLLREGLRLLEGSPHGAAWQIDLAWTLLCRCLWMRGEIAELAAALPERIARARELGNRYRETMLRMSGVVLVELAADRPAAARAALQAAEAGWRRDDFDLQRVRLVLAGARVDLYAGEGLRALRRLGAALPGLTRARLMLLPPVRLEVLTFRGLAALAASDEAPRLRPLLLRLASSDARALERGRLRWATAAAAQLRAGVAARRGRAPEVGPALAAAEEGARAAGWTLWAEALRRRRGAWLGGDEGRALLHEADAWLAERGVLRPERLCAMMTGEIPER